MPSVAEIRIRAVTHSLFPAGDLPSAFSHLGFVQADPIRAPARAQDLILRHRVRDYHAGDLEREYAALDLEEEDLYVYGFLPRETAQFLFHAQGKRLTSLQTKILDIAKEGRALHPRSLERLIGKGRSVNAWGSYSSTAKLAMEALHERGLLRIAGREKGVRIYESGRPQVITAPPAERFRRLVLVVANLLAPLPQQSLQEVVARIRRPAVMVSSKILKQLLDEGELVRAMVDGVPYVALSQSGPVEEPPAAVRFLSPFDPLVWDRRRFEHLWGWPYRFEAYTPPGKRRWGYYALPLLWRDQVIGWANLGIADGKLSVDLGFVNGEPVGKEFKSALRDEIGSVETFLGLMA